MVMTFILHPLSHYNFILEPYAQFFLSLLKYIFIDFPSHFILSLIDVYRDTTTCDKLIFPSAITRILRHFCLLSRVYTLFGYVCHKHCYRLTMQGLVSTKAAANRDDDSSSFFHSFHLCSFIFCEWSHS